MTEFCLTSAKDSKTDCNSEAVDKCIDLIANKNPLAVEELYHRTSASVYSFALSILKNTQDAEDVLHDCYVQIYSAAKSYRSCGKPMAWILTVARNLCLKKLRDRRKTAELPEEDWEPYLSSNENISAEDKLIVSECLRTLSDEERQIVVLYAVSGFKHREIAALLDMSLSTVLSKYNRALKKLRKIL